MPDFYFGHGNGFFVLNLILKTAMELCGFMRNRLL